MLMDVPYPDYSLRSHFSHCAKKMTQKKSHLLRDVFAVADCRLELGRVGVAGHVDDNFDVVGR